MSMLQTLEESMKVLDVLSVFLSEDSDNYIQDEKIRTLLEDVFEKIHAIYELVGDEAIEEELRDKWETEESEEPEESENEYNVYRLDDLRKNEE